jgi:small basic protein
MLIFILFILGIFIGTLIPTMVSAAYSLYFAIAILAALDTAIGGLAAYLGEKFDTKIFISGFFGNAIIAALLTYLGDKLGVPLYYAAIFTFGTRLFQNFAILRRFLLNKYTKKGNI